MTNELEIEVGDKVHFMLDCHWAGDGIVQALSATLCKIKLTTACNEFSIDEIITVGYDEVIDIIDPE